MAIRKMICITCPRGYHLEVDDETLQVRGNTCPKGEEYGRNEVTDPRRVLTSTVRIEGASIARLPVKTDRPLPKEKMRDCMALLDRVTAVSPVRTGQVLAAGILGTDVNIVATKDL